MYDNCSFDCVVGADKRRLDCSRAMNIRRKGADGEREIANILRGYGYNTFRGQQHDGSKGEADVEGLPFVHIEVKRVEALNIDSAMDQACRDSFAESIRRGQNMIPAVFHRKNDDRKRGSTRGRWKVTLFLDDFMRLYEGGGENIGKEQKTP